MTTIQQRDAQTVWPPSTICFRRFGERAQATEDLRRLPDDNVAELDEAGFFTLLQPEQWGGLQCDPTLFYEAIRRLASACGSTGWVSGIIGVHNWHLAQFDQQAQEEVWGDDPKSGSRPRTRRWAPVSWSTAATWSTAPGSGLRDVTTPPGLSSAAPLSRTADRSTSAAS